MTDQEMVFLKKAYIVPLTGSRYPRGKYALKSLPVAIRDNKEYVQFIDKVSEVETSSKDKVLTPSKDAVKKIEKTEFIIEDEDAPVNVNDATLSELVEVSGIGRKTAEAIIENRPFTDFTDLKKRVSFFRVKPEDLNIKVAPPKAYTEVTGMSIVKEKVDKPLNTEAERRKKRSEVLEERIAKKESLLAEYAESLKEKKESQNLEE